MAKAEFTKGVDEGNYKIVGEFTNEHGEAFVVFLAYGSPVYFVTGDELDWEVGYQYVEGVNHLVEVFITSDAEMSKVKEIVKAHHGDLRLS